jgi:pimeloyl-ACP methyl ester carboxylesterase
MVKISCITMLLIMTSFFVKAGEHKQAYARSVTYRADGSEIVYYLQVPEQNNTDFPIVVLCEGSYVRKKPIESVLRLNSMFQPILGESDFGLLTVEKWGVDGDSVDEAIFHEHNTRSQRIQDHLTVLSALEEQKIHGWNGTYVLIGGSEGGDVVSWLMIENAETVVAAINYAGIGAWGFQEELWAWLGHMRTTGPWWQRLYMQLYCWWEDVPKTREAYDQIVAEIMRDQIHTKWKFGQTHKYLADAFALHEMTKKLYTLKIPLLIVVGTDDPLIDSADAFVEYGQRCDMPITYWRIEALAHGISTLRPDLFPKSIEWLRETLSLM